MGNSLYIEDNFLVKWFTIYHTKWVELAVKITYKISNLYPHQIVLRIQVSSTKTKTVIAY